MVDVNTDNNSINISVSTSGSTGSVNATNNAAQYWSDKAREWAISESVVSGEDNSSKWYANKSKQYKEGAESAVNGFSSTVESATTEFNTLVSGAESDINGLTSDFSNLYDEKSGALQSEYTGYSSDLDSAKDTAIADIQTAGIENYNNVSGAGTTALNDITTAKNTAVCAVQSEGDTQVARVQSTGFYMRDGKLYYLENGVEKEFKSGEWGSIEGDIKAQEDLQQALIDSTFIPFSIYKGSIDDNGNPNIAYTDSLPVEITGSFPAFSSAEEATTGKDGVKLLDGSYYACIGQNYATSTDRTIRSLAPQPGGYIVFEFNNPVQLTHFQFRGSTDAQWHPKAYCPIIQGSNNNTDWTTIKTWGTGTIDKVQNGSFAIDESIITEVRFKYIRVGYSKCNGSYGSSGIACINFEYIAGSVQGSNNLYFNVSLSNPVIAKTAEGKVFSVNLIELIDISSQTDGLYTIFLTPNGAELKQCLIKTAQQPEIDTNAIWYDYYNAYSVQDNNWVPGYEGVPLGTVDVENGVIQSVKNYPYTSLSRLKASDTTNLIIPDFSKGESKICNTVYQAEINGWLFIKGEGNGANGGVGVDFSLDGTFTDIYYTSRLGNFGLSQYAGANLSGGLFGIIPKGLYYKIFTGVYFGYAKFFPMKGAD